MTITFCIIQIVDMVPKGKTDGEGLDIIVIVGTVKESNWRFYVNTSVEDPGVFVSY